VYGPLNFVIIFIKLKGDTNFIMKNNATEFDSIANSYGNKRVKDLGKFGKYGDSAFLYKAQFLKKLFKKEPKSILDFGCGIGENIPYLHAQFKNTRLFGCDVSSKSVEIAKENYEYCKFDVVDDVDGLKIYKDIDCVFISTVLHHIPPKEHNIWIDCLYNILSDDAGLIGHGGGTMCVFEHNMNNPVTKSVVTKSEIDKDATMLSAHYCKRLLQNVFCRTKIDGKELRLAGNGVKLKYTYFFPWRNWVFANIERMLYRVPFGAQYCVYAEK
jgi:SAM-dependent methyltransferase